MLGTFACTSGHDKPKPSQNTLAVCSHVQTNLYFRSRLSLVANSCASRRFATQCHDSISEILALPISSKSSSRFSSKGRAMRFTFRSAVSSASFLRARSSPPPGSLTPMTRICGFSLSFSGDPGFDQACFIALAKPATASPPCLILSLSRSIRPKVTTCKRCDDGEQLCSQNQEQALKLQ